MANVLIPLAQGCEELEAVTLIDLFRRAGIQVVTAGLDEKPVKASRGTVLIPDMTLDAALKHEYDLIALPGGLPGANHLRDDPRIQRCLQSMAAKNKFIAAICAAPKALAKAGLLDGKRVTCYPGSLDDSQVKNLHYLEQAVVIDGNIVTSRGPGTAMDFALTLIELLLGKQPRQDVEAGLQRMVAGL
jgi:4-methyl-5(b-hydroxyethyl)-thiazole monophosphate biosynthesis